MAPSVVETTTTTTRPVPAYKLHVGNYKEIDAHNVDRETETGENGAKVSWTGFS